MKNYLTFSHIAPLIIALFLSIFCVKTSHGLTLILTIVPTTVIALIFYYIIIDIKDTKSLFRDNIMITYLAGIAIHFLQFAEEFTGGFHAEFAIKGSFIYRLTKEIYNTTPYTTTGFLFFYMVAYAILIIALIGFVRKEKGSLFFLSFFVMTGLIGNGIQHIVYAIMVGGYFPGLVFSIIEFIIGIALIFQLVTSEKDNKIQV